jgi:endogenous inhibitor of DNA gyrase (YacG/DUF329 family)
MKIVLRESIYGFLEGDVLWFCSKKCRKKYFKSDLYYDRGMHANRARSSLEVEDEEIAEKEESEKEAHEDRNIGKCPKCGTEVSSPKKKWTMAGRLEMLEIGLFDCPTCKKPFREILNKKTKREL